MKHVLMIGILSLKNITVELGNVLIRMYKHIDYYKDNPQIKNTFDFLKIVIDNWIIKG